MRIQTTLPLVIVLSGCDELSDFLKGDGYGDGGDCGVSAFDAEGEAEAGIEQANYYRDLMDLNPGLAEPALDESAQAHAAYMYYVNGITHQESSSNDCYTGEWVWDRMESAGYPLEPGSTWAEVVAFGFSPEEAVDGWMGTIYHREPFTVARWREVGFGQADLFASMSFVSPYPSGVTNAVIYPTDGQTQIPTSFDSDQEIPDPAPDRGVVGYPITVTVGGTTVTGSDADPYGLQLLDAALFDANGNEVSVRLADPSDDSMLSAMAYMMPLQPLDAGAEYEAEMTVRWNGTEETLYSAFTTAVD